MMALDMYSVKKYFSVKSILFSYKYPSSSMVSGYLALRTLDPDFFKINMKARIW